MNPMPMSTFPLSGSKVCNRQGPFLCKARTVLLCPWLAVGVPL